MEWLELQPFSEAEKEGSEGLFMQQWLSGKLKTGITDSRPPQASTLPLRIIAGGYPDHQQSLQRLAQYLQQRQHPHIRCPG